MIVLDRAATHTDGADQDALLIDDGHATRKGDESAIGMLDAKEWSPRLGKGADLPGRHGEETGRLGLLDGDVDTADPGVIHAGKGFQFRAGIHHGDTHLSIDGSGFRQGGVHGFLSLFEGDMHEGLPGQVRVTENRRIQPYPLSPWRVAGRRRRS